MFLFKKVVLLLHFLLLTCTTKQARVLVVYLLHSSVPAGTSTDHTVDHIVEHRP